MIPVRKYMLLLLLWAGAAAAEDVAAELQRAGRQVELLENKTSLVRSQYLEFRDQSMERTAFERKLNDGQVLMLLKDYVRAALVFSDLVQDERYREHPAYAEVLFNLAESLFANKNYIEARAYFLQTVRHTHGRIYLKQSLVRLMQIALNINDYAAVDDVYKQLSAQPELITPQAKYLWAKTLLNRNIVDKASAVLASIGGAEDYYLQAQYLLGVALIRQGKTAEALEIYRRLKQAKARRADEARIIELAWLAEGRLLYDSGNYVQALDCYQNIPHTSPLFDQTLLETAWNYISLANQSENPQERERYFNDALRTLEILEVSTPDSTLVPKTLLLRGHVLEKMGRFEQAAEVFMQVSRDYGQVRAQIDQLFSAHADPVAYFNQLAFQSLDRIDLASFLPPLAARWLPEGEDMAAALSILKDLEVGQRYVAESRQLLDKLQRLLESEDRINLVPAMKEALKIALEVENGRLLVEKTLSDLDERIVSEHIKPDEKRSLEELRRQREELEKAITGLPVTGDDFQKRQQAIRGHIEELERQIYQSVVTVMGMKAQLKAMDEWLTANALELAEKGQAVEAFREEIARGRSAAGELEKELSELQVELSTEKARLGLDRETLAQEEELRGRYSEILARERQLAEQIQSRLGPQGVQQLSQVNQLRQRLEKLKGEIAAIRRGIDEKVNLETEKLKKRAMEEYTRLEEFQNALEKLAEESKNLAGKVAYESLRDVYDKFYQLVLEGEVGMLDVAWGEKQAKTRAITELGRKLGAERKQLYQEFKGALEDTN